MQIYRRYPDEKGHTDITVIDPKELRKKSPQAMDLSVPTVFFFPGFQTIDGQDIQYEGEGGKPSYRQPAKTSLNLKSSVVESHLGDAADLYRPKESPDQPRVNFYTLTYSQSRVLPKRVMDLMRGAFNAIAPRAMQLRNDTPRRGKLIDAATFMNFPETYYRQDAKDFVQAMILPAIMDDKGGFLPKEEVIQKFRNITFVGDSYGSTFAHQLGNYLKYRLEKSEKHPEGFAPEEVDEIIRQIVFLGGSNIVVNDRPGQPNRYTGIYFEGRGDKFIALARKMENIRSLILPQLFSGRKSEAIISDPAFNGISTLSDSGYYEPAQEMVHIIQAKENHYEPTPEKDNMGFKNVDKGIVVEFDVPTRFEVLLKEQGTPLARYYKNEPELHQSYSYFYPIPTHRDHADLYGRVLRNAVCRASTEEITPAALVTRDAIPYRRKNTDGLPTGFQEMINYQRMNAHLNQQVAQKLAEASGEKAPAMMVG